MASSDSDYIVEKPDKNVTATLFKANTMAHGGKGADTSTPDHLNNKNLEEIKESIASISETNSVSDQSSN